MLLSRLEGLEVRGQTGELRGVDSGPARQTRTKKRRDPVAGASRQYLGSVKLSCDGFKTAYGASKGLEISIKSGAAFRSDSSDLALQRLSHKGFRPPGLRRLRNDSELSAV